MDLEISRGGGANFQKSFENFATFFSTKLIFWEFYELSQTTIKALIWPDFFCVAGKFKKKAFLGTFWKISTKK